MQEYQYFKQTGDPDIHAAIVGISRQDWIYLNASEHIREATLIMGEHQFDILPKVNKDKSITSYYHTITWSKYSQNNIKLDKIQNEDKLYYLTHIKDVIRLMHEQNRNFYFLTNHTTIIGLITISNLNCKQVSLYFYNLICSLERKLGRFVHKLLDKNQILESLERLGSEKGIPSALNTVRRYSEDSQKGVDGSIIEYLYLSDLLLLIVEHKLYPLLNYKNSKEFEGGSGKLKDLRNTIAHPKVNGRLFRQFVNIVSSFDFCIGELKRKRALLRSNSPGINSPDRMGRTEVLLF